MKSFFSDEDLIAIKKIIVDGHDKKYLYDCIIKRDLNNDLINEALNIINDEYLMEGINSDYEPNNYGIKLNSIKNSFVRLLD